MLRSRARSCAPLLRVALDGSIHHETMNDRRGRPSYRRAQEFNVLHFICETALRAALGGRKPAAGGALDRFEEALLPERPADALGAKQALDAAAITVPVLDCTP